MYDSSRTAAAASVGRMGRDLFPPASRTPGGSSSALAALPPFSVGRPASRALWEMLVRPQESKKPGLEQGRLMLNSLLSRPDLNPGKS